jgi:alkylation response protein AidB-like acyl-CoA dehydrogenase
MTAVIEPGALAPDLALIGVAERARAFCAEYVDGRAGDFERDAWIPAEVVAGLGAYRLWGAVLPKAVGGTGDGMEAFGDLHAEVGRACSSVRSLLTVHSMALHALERWGNAALKLRWREALIEGNLVGAFCLSETETGSDARSVTTTATPVADGFLLNGRKRWVTAGQIAQVLLVFARTPVGVSGFLVDADGPGVSREPVTELLGTRASMVADISFDDVFLPREQLLGREGMGLMLAVDALDIGRLSVASGSVGVIQAALDESLRHAAKRVQGGGPIFDHQLVQRLIARMSVDLQAARLLCTQAGRLKDKRDPGTINATCVAKYYSSTAAMRAAQDAVQILGAVGCGPGSTVARLFRDAKIAEIIEGSTQIQELLIAEAARQEHATRQR